MNKVILFKKRPVGRPALSDFEFTSETIPDPMTGYVLLKTLYGEVESIPLVELKEVENIFIKMGVEKKISKEVATQVSKDKNHWVT